MTRHTPYDFRRPNKFSRDHVRALQIASETFARQFSTVLGTALRSVCNVTVASVDQLTYDEHIRSLENPSYLAVIALDPLPGAGLLHWELPLAMTAVERLLGGPGDAELHRPLTEIEEHLIRRVIERGLKELDYAFESLAKLSSSVKTQESNPVFAQIAAPSDMTVVVAFDVRIGEIKGRASLCLSYSSLQPVLEALDSQILFPDRDRGTFGDLLREAVCEVPVAVSVRFEPVVLTSAEIVALAPGDVLPLRHPVDEPLTVTAGGVPCLAAVTGKKGRRLACLIVARDRSET